MAKASSASGPEAIGMWMAVWHALRGHDIAYFPRVEVAGTWKSLESGDVLAAASNSLADISATDEDLNKVLSLARQSLDEVKSQTEYQDGKATRLLTIITFVGAISGALFGKFIDSYPLHAFWPPNFGAAGLRLVAVAGAYMLFAGFALYAACGALVTFHAIRGRFRYPQSSATGDTKSFLFFQAMLAVPPAQWAASFKAKHPDGRGIFKLATDLEFRYFENYVTETYLIATKVADKVRFLEPAQRLQLIAIRLLLAWLIVVTLDFSFVAPVGKAAVADATSASNTNNQPGATGTQPGAAGPAAPGQGTVPGPPAAQPAAPPAAVSKPVAPLLAAPGQGGAPAVPGAQHATPPAAVPNPGASPPAKH